MTETLKIVIPTAGWATRMRPQTWSKPKPLISVAGRTALDHLLDTFHTIPERMPAEYVIIYSPGLGETQIPPFMQEHYPQLKVSYVLQPVMKGQADALWLAREHLTGPLLVCFSDTLIETDFSFLAGEKMDAVAWVKPVPDPRRFGVAEVGPGGLVTRLVEKPQTKENNLAVVGCYYFRQAENLLSAIEEQFRRGTSLKGEYFLTDTINIMIERGLKMRTQNVAVWLDTGTIQATLETNRYLLEHGRESNPQDVKGGNVQILPPVFIHATAEISDSVIGPHVSIGAECVIADSRIENSILEAGVTVNAAALKGSFIGRQAWVQGRSADDPPLTLNVGDNSSVS
ncbi:MAG: glucose-1-phosphate thymidylyltransferase [Anaerolineaceae bacterium]|nr:MAG: glucose-1-phosphate thymidylyltransferase [Anaerolineaceae bacterium]